VSSPIAKERKSSVDRALIATHQKMSHGHRIDILARQFAERIRELGPTPGHGPLRVLDVGCGDMTLADAVSAKLESVDFRCVDIHPCPPSLLETDPRWQRYSRFDGVHLPFDDKSFDVVMFSDVLHHVPASIRTPLLVSAARVGRSIIIKDHLEYGWWSRQSLRAMDWVGNFGYGVSIPDRYFDRDLLEHQCREAEISIRRLDVGIPLYDHLPVVRSLLSPDWQFIAICQPTALQTARPGDVGHSR
jgi:SAM-dependent methyltransferase